MISLIDHQVGRIVLREYLACEIAWD